MLKPGDTFKQVHRKVIQLGKGTVAYSPPSAKGAAPKVEAVTSVVLELPRMAWKDDSKWKAAVMDAQGAFQGMVTKAVEGTDFAGTKVTKVGPVTDKEKTTCIRGFARVPVAVLPELLGHSGMNEQRIFIRQFVPRNPTEQEQKDNFKLVNLWMTGEYITVKQEAEAVDPGKRFGLAWNSKGYAVKTKESEADELAPILTGKTFSKGEKYEISGADRDWPAELLFEAFSIEAEAPWEGAMSNKLLFKKGGRWVIRAATPPPRTLNFLDDYVISIRPVAEVRTTKEVQAPRRPTAGSHAAVAAGVACDAGGDMDCSNKEGEAGEEAEKQGVETKQEKVDKPAKRPLPPRPRHRRRQQPPHRRHLMT